MSSPIAITMTEKREKPQIQDDFPDIPPDYSPIEKSEFRTKVPINQDYLAMVCQCVYKAGEPFGRACGESSDCTNRHLFIECNPSECPCGSACQNQRIQKKEYPKIQIKRTLGKGFGVFCNEDLGANQFVIEYVGEVVDQNEFVKRMKKHDSPHFYFMTLQRDQGNMARFINHSCDPNCATQKWMIEGIMRIGIFTLKAIPKGTELTFNYNFEHYGEPQKCLCGEPKCKGVIGMSKNVGDQPTEEEEEEEEAESDEEKQKKSRDPSPFKDESDLSKMIMNLLQTDESKKVIWHLKRLEVTENATVLKRFVYLHGIKIISCLIKDFKYDLNILRLLLRVLIKLPLQNKNAIEENKLDKKLMRLCDHEDVIVSLGAKKILEKWSKLSSVSRIPKKESGSESNSAVVTNSSYQLKAMNFEDPFSKRFTSDSSTLNNSSSSLNNSSSQYNSSVQHVSSNQYNSSSSNYQKPKPYQPPLPLPPGWSSAVAEDGRIYFYNTVTRISQWEFPKPEPDPPKVVNPHAYIEGVSGEGIDKIIERAKEQAAASRAAAAVEQKPATEKKKTIHVSTSNTSEAFSKYKHMVSHCVVHYLSRYKDKFERDEFKSVARKIAHDLYEKEVRYQTEKKGEKCVPVYLIEEKRAKIKEFIIGYLERKKII